MNFKNLLFCALLFMGFYSASNAQTFTPANMDFELGTTANWDYYKGTVAPGPVYSLVSTPPISGLHTLTSGLGGDAYGLFPVVCQGSYSLKLGHDTIAYNTDAASYYVRIPSNGIYNLIYHYAVVLQSPFTHLSSEQPRFEVSAFDSASGTAIPAGAFTTTGIAGLMTSSVTPTVNFKPWSTVNFSLTGYSGHTVMVKFIAADCGDGGHFGYAYVDVVSCFLRLTSVPCGSSTVSLVAPVGYSAYNWTDSATMSMAYGATATVSVPAPTVTTTYAVVLTPYAGHGPTDIFYTTVVPTLSLPAITGTTTVPVTHTTTLSDAVTGGTWTSRNTAIATVGSSSGIVTGVAAGTDTIFYSVGSTVCDVYTVITVTSTLGASSLYNTGAGTIDLFPNPATTQLNIQWKNIAKEHADIRVTDVTGRELYTAPLYINAASGQTQIDVSGLNAGIYMVTIKSDHINYCGKLLIEK